MGYYNVYEHGRDITTFRVHGSGGYYNVYKPGRDITTSRVHGRRDITTFFGSISRMDGILQRFSEHRIGAFAAALDALPPHA